MGNRAARWITRCGALSLAPVRGRLPLHRSGGGNEPSVIPAAFATLDPAKMRVGGLEPKYANSVFNRLTMQDTKLLLLADLATS